MSRYLTSLLLRNLNPCLKYTNSNKFFIYIAEGIDVTKASASEEFVAIGINIYTYLHIAVFLYEFYMNKD